MSNGKTAAAAEPRRNKHTVVDVIIINDINMNIYTFVMEHYHFLLSIFKCSKCVFRNDTARNCMKGGRERGWKIDKEPSKLFEMRVNVHKV